MTTLVYISNAISDVSVALQSVHVVSRRLPPNGGALIEFSGKQVTNIGISFNQVSFDVVDSSTSLSTTFAAVVLQYYYTWEVVVRVVESTVNVVLPYSDRIFALVQLTTEYDDDLSEWYGTQLLMSGVRSTLHPLLRPTTMDSRTHWGRTWCYLATKMYSTGHLSMRGLSCSISTAACFRLDFDKGNCFVGPNCAARGST